MRTESLIKLANNSFTDQSHTQQRHVFIILIINCKKCCTPYLLFATHFNLNCALCFCKCLTTVQVMSITTCYKSFSETSTRVCQRSSFRLILFSSLPLSEGWIKNSELEYLQTTVGVLYNYLKRYSFGLLIKIKCVYWSSLLPATTKCYKILFKKEVKVVNYW